MSWATRRKLIYLFSFIISLSVLIGVPLFVFTREQPTCFDSKQNGDEQGVDCGGSCTRICKPLALNPVVLWQRSFKVASDVYSAAAYIQNPNVNAEADHVSYIFTLYDKNNVVITQRKGETYIPAGKSFLVFESLLQANNRIPDRTVFEWTSDPDWQKVRKNLPALTVQNPTLLNASTSPSVEADIQNPTFTPLNRVDVTAVVYSLEGNAVATSKTFITNLDQKSSQHVVFTWPYPFPQTGSACEVPADIMLGIDRSGSMAVDGTNPPQPLTNVKKAANSFLRQFNEQNQVGLVTFATNASIDHTLTSKAGDVSTMINSISILKAGIQYTNIDDVLAKSLEELNSERHNPNAKKVIVLLTDGVANYPEKKGDTLYASTVALDRSAFAKQQGIEIYTIGLGTKLDVDFLKNIASAPDHYYEAITSGDLMPVYTQIATAICKHNPARVEIIPTIPLH